jgi:hypothetical protein
MSAGGTRGPTLLKKQVACGPYVGAWSISAA